MKFAHEQSQTRYPQYQCTYQFWWKSIDVYSCYHPETKNGRTCDRQTDIHTDFQLKTIIPRHCCVAGYKNSQNNFNQKIPRWQPWSPSWKFILALFSCTERPTDSKLDRKYSGDLQIQNSLNHTDQKSKLSTKAAFLKIYLELLLNRKANGLETWLEASGCLLDQK